MKRLLILTIGLSLLLAGCADIELQTVKNLKYLQSYDAETETSSVTTYAIFETPNKKLVVYQAQDDNAVALLIKDHKYDVTVSIASRFYNGNCIYSMKADG